MLISLWVPFGDDAEPLPEQAIVCGHHHLSALEVWIGEAQVNDVRAVIAVDRIDDVVEHNQRKFILLGHRQQERES
ncbi:hypothetical protein D9M69_678990 [compost metagenome]